MKEIELTQGQVAIVDDEDYEYLSQWKWHLHNAYGGGMYARRSSSPPNKSSIYMHRVIMKAKKENLVDHIDGNGLNNLRGNLRLCNHAENSRNRKKNKNNTVGYKGVSFDKSHNIFRVDISVEGKRVFVGNYKKQEEAALAYDKKAKELYGEFANLNFPEGES